MWPLQGGGTGGPPTIADYDGDMMPEIGLVDAHAYSVYQPDGTVEWSAPVTDASSHATGSWSLILKEMVFLRLYMLMSWHCGFLMGVMVKFACGMTVIILEHCTKLSYRSRY